MDYNENKDLGASMAFIDAIDALAKKERDGAESVNDAHRRFGENRSQVIETIKESASMDFIDAIDAPLKNTCREGDSARSSIINPPIGGYNRRLPRPPERWRFLRNFRQFLTPGFLVGWLREPVQILGIGMGPGGIGPNRDGAELVGGAR